MSDQNNRRIELLEDGQVRLEETLNTQTKILVRLDTMITHNSEVLNEHQRRSTASEKRLDLLEQKDAHYKSFIKGATWVFGGIGGLLSLGWMASNIIDKLIK